MSRLKGSYSKGDWIVHANYGVGQIRGKEKKLLEGEKQAFLKVKTFNGIYWLPVSNIEVDYIRPLASKYQINRALTLIRKPPGELPDDYRKRGKKISQALRDVSLYTKARMLRDLHGRKITAKLNQMEKGALEKIKKVILNEWSVVKGEDSQNLSEKLERALEISIEKETRNEKG